MRSSSSRQSRCHRKAPGHRQVRLAVAGQCLDGQGADVGEALFGETELRRALRSKQRAQAARIRLDLRRARVAKTFSMRFSAETMSRCWMAVRVLSASAFAIMSARVSDAGDEGIRTRDEGDRAEDQSITAGAFGTGAGRDRSLARRGRRHGIAATSSVPLLRKSKLIWTSG